MTLRFKLLAGMAICVAIATGSYAAAETEADRVVKLLLTPPDIEVQPGFVSELLVPPGQLYDPFYPIIHDNAVWVTDNGPNLGTTGSRIVKVSAQGEISVVIPATTSNTLIAGDFAPRGFGRFSGQLIMASQPNSTGGGAFVGQIIQQLDPANSFRPSLICALPKAGTMGNGVPGIATDARFGPKGSLFAGRLFVGTGLNSMIYQMDTSGHCSAFAEFGKYGVPTGIRFTPDGKEMLVTTAGYDFGQASPNGSLRPGGGTILRVSADGTIDAQPLATGFDAPAGLDFAPDGFGAFAGQIFVADAGPVLQYPPPVTQRLNARGKVYRITADGQKHLVATGFVNPLGVQFVNNQLWVTDLNGVYFGLYGGRELPDGFIDVITAK